MAYPTVRADSDFRASWRFQVIDIKEGETIGHELAQHLLDTGCPVTEVDPAEAGDVADGGQSGKSARGKR